jgi:hypothetical protein
MVKDAYTLSIFEGQEILKIIPLKDADVCFVITNELHIYELKPMVHLGKLSFSIEQCILGYNDEILDVRFE